MREESEVQIFSLLDSMTEYYRVEGGRLNQKQRAKMALQSLKVTQKIEIDILVDWDRQCRAETKSSCSRSSRR